MRFRLVLAAFVLLSLVLGMPGVVRADTKTKLDVDVGWDWRPRGEHWTPVFVTASTDKPRNVVLTVEWPQGSGYSMRIQQAMTIDVAPRTFPILVPVHGWQYEQASFTLADANSGKSLAHFPKDDDQGASFGGGNPDSSAAFVGVSGAPSTLVSLHEGAGIINIGFLEPRRVPTMAMGFDSLTILVLNGPNLGLAGFGPTPLNDAQQQAIVDWVRGGGTLILWPGDGGLPASGPLGEVLPAKVGNRADIKLSPADLSAIGLSSRFQNLASYALEPRAGAERIPLLNQGQASAYASRLGLGRIVLAPINVAELQLSNTSQSRDLWRPLLKGVYTFNGEVAAADSVDAKDPSLQQSGSTFTRYSDNSDTDEGRQNVASMRIADFLGNVPGAGQIGFSYIAYVLLGLMLVVGPVDWFVLKRLGRQPWTWVTTTGWVTLVTTGAIFAGYLFKSGDLHYKTLQTIDQVDNATVASTDYVALYSSRTRSYEIKTEPDGWWQPAGINEYGGGALKLDLDFHQTTEGNTPEEMMVNVWSLRFLRGDHTGVGPAVLSAELRNGTLSDGRVGVIGVIRNLSSKPLKNIHLTTREGSYLCTLNPVSLELPLPTINVIAPLTTVKVQAVLNPSMVPETRQQIYNRYEQYEQTSEPDLWRVAADLNVHRGKEMAAKIATGKFAIVYAETDNPTPSAKLVGQQAIEHHWQFIRALVELHDDREAK